MRNRQFQHSLCIMILLATTAPLGAQDDSASDARKAIQAVYDQQSTAAARLDPVGEFTGYAPEFTLEDRSNKVESLSQLQQKARNVMPTILMFKLKKTIEKITVTGAVAILRVKGHIQVLHRGPQGDYTQITSDNTSADTWKKGAKGWLLTRSKLLSKWKTSEMGVPQ